MNKKMFKVVILNFLVCFSIDVAFANEEHSPLGFMNLIPSEDDHSIEQKPEEYCAKLKPVYAKCDKKNIRWSLGFYEEPEDSKQPIGHIEIVFEKGGVDAFFEITDGPGDKTIKVHSVGEGHDTIDSIYFPRGEVKYNWVQLAKIPFEKPVWINLKKDWNSKMFIISPTRSVYISKKYGAIIIKTITKETVEFRSEYPNDMPCDRDVDPKLKVPPIRKAPVADFMDKNGHLNIYRKYPRGC